jgi:hypothetical protein
VSFDFSYTCPKIDKAIARAKSEINDQIGNILDEACPLLERVRREKLAEDYGETLYSSIEDCFEATRSTNEEMRREAERQIARLESDLADAQAEIAQLQRAEA